jgi:cation diffusion facilitator CzcD-associated flavoprotein CzcO
MIFEQLKFFIYETTMSDVQQIDAIIVGAGFSGMYQLLSLRDKLGLSVKVLEAADGVGGTWYWNRYPGARCDSESHSYMFYFSKELVHEWEWSERYPQQPEILRYLNYVADKFQLRPDIALNTRMSKAEYDEQTSRWLVTTDKGEQYSAKYLITAVGCLSSANLPKVEGLKDFTGEWYHTGLWPHASVDFKGKRVAVIGTGSTGIQAIPVIAAEAAHVTVFQRTPNYSLPARHAPLTPEFKQYAKEHADDIYQVMTTNTNGHPFSIADRSALEVSDEEREAIFEEQWKMGGFQFRAAFKDILSSQQANDTAAEFIRNKIREIVKDPVTAELLSDIDHPFAAKRPPIDADYFETYNRDNVSLVSIRQTPIERITATGIKTTAQDYAFDTIVFATGFDAMTGSLVKMDITGREQRTLKDYWQAGPKTYLGLQVPGFPNMFTITGPGSPSVLCNMVPAIEQHVDWITDCIRHMQQHDLNRIETTEQASHTWQQEVDRAANATLLPKVKHSWYLGANIPGKPQVFMPYAGGLAHYREICNQAVAQNYKGFEFNN